MLTRRKGFTLIELLVVMAIIIILAGLLMPALSTAREQARKTNCVNNLKQISTAFQLYTAAFNEAYPPVATWGQALTGAGLIDDPNVFDCQSSAAAQGTPAAPNYTYSALPTGTTASTVVIVTDAGHASGGVWLYAGGNVKVK